MTKKLVWAALCLALASGCSSAPRWDEAAFPNQVYYDGTSATAQPLAQSK